MKRVKYGKFGLLNILRVTEEISLDVLPHDYTGHLQSTFPKIRRFLLPDKLTIVSVKHVSRHEMLHYSSQTLKSCKIYLTTSQLQAVPKLLT